MINPVEVELKQKLGVTKKILSTPGRSPSAFIRAKSDKESKARRACQNGHDFEDWKYRDSSKRLREMRIQARRSRSSSHADSCLKPLN